jgi:hypothetical protein
MYRISTSDKLFGRINRLIRANSKAHSGEQKPGLSPTSIYMMYRSRVSVDDSIRNRVVSRFALSRAAVWRGKSCSISLPNLVFIVYMCNHSVISIYIYYY